MPPKVEVRVNPVKFFIWGLYGVIGALVLIMCFKLFENLDANKLMVIQSPFSGKLTWHTSAGTKWQGFGKVTKYGKRSMYNFQLPVRFMDGGHATMKGSVQFEMPLDVDHLNDIQSKFGNEDAVKSSLIQTVVNKSVYMTGPMLSSKESYGEKRNYLINWVEDQIQNGVFKTLSRDTVIKDNFSGTEKTVTVVDIVRENSIPSRQEESALTRFGVKAFNFSIENMPYDQTVEAQIQQQQKITMEIQTSIANAKRAEQNVITVEADGRAASAKARWEQEVIKARAVTESQQKLEVARLDAQAAEQKKREQILLGEGEAERKKLVMAADGALEKKLDAYVKVNENYAEAIKSYQGAWVPSIVMGGDSKSASGANDLVNLLMAKTAKELSLDVGVPKGGNR
jgi:hypothetical protein